MQIKLNTGAAKAKKKTTTKNQKTFQSLKLKTL